MYGSVAPRAWQAAAAYDPQHSRNNAATCGYVRERKSNVTFGAGGSAGNGGGIDPGLRPETAEHEKRMRAKDFEIEKIK